MKNGPGKWSGKKPQNGPDAGSPRVRRRGRASRRRRQIVRGASGDESVFLGGGVTAEWFNALCAGLVGVENLRGSSLRDSRSLKMDLRGR